MTTLSLGILKFENFFLSTASSLLRKYLYSASAKSPSCHFICWASNSMSTKAENNLTDLFFCIGMFGKVLNVFLIFFAMVLRGIHWNILIYTKFIIIFTPNLEFSPYPKFINRSTTFKLTKG